MSYFKFDNFYIIWKTLDQENNLYEYFIKFIFEINF